MNIDITKTLELMLSIAALMGVVWRIFQNFERIDRRLELHIQDTINKDERQTLLINQLNEKIDHKTRRLLAGLNEVNGYLEKNGNFRRRQFYGEEREKQED